VEIVVQDFIVAPVQVNSIALTKQSEVVTDFEPDHPDVVRGYRKPLRHGPATSLKRNGTILSAGASYVDALRVVSFHNQNRIPRMRGVGSLLNGAPWGASRSVIGVIPFSGINVKRVCERRGTEQGKRRRDDQLPYMSFAHAR
jgi:hypothetical protein